MAQGTFSRACAEFAKSAPAKEVAVFVSSSAQIRSSIRDGSALTGAPATPVSLPKYPKAGSLRDAITLTFPDANTALIYTTKWFAPNVEHNSENHRFVSGGPHGWALTIAAFEKIVDTTAKRQAGAR